MVTIRSAYHLQNVIYMQLNIKITFKVYLYVIKELNTSDSGVKTEETQHRWYNQHMSISFQHWLAVTHEVQQH